MTLVDQHQRESTPAEDVNINYVGHWCLHQKLKLCLRLLKTKAYFRKRTVLCIVFNSVHRLQAHQTCDYCNNSQRGMILTSICHLQLLVLCMRGFPFQLMEFCSYLKAAKRSMGASSAAYNLKDSAYFQSSLHSSSLKESCWTSAQTDTHLLHICE